MFKIENICKKISGYIARELNLNDDRKSVINYGIFAFIQIMICIALVMIFGVIFNVMIEALIVSFTTSMLRKSSGGAHASSPEKCAIIGTVVSVGMGIIAKYAHFDLILIIVVGSIIFAWSYYIIYKLAPVDSAAKPIRSHKMKKRLKKVSIITLSVYLAIVLILILSYLLTENLTLLTYSLCIYIGLSWQIFSLTKTGHLALRQFGH